jgi:hypothetical protein
MIANLDGEVRWVQKFHSDKKNKDFFKYLIEQKTPGATEKVFIKSEKDGRKVGDKISVKVNVYMSHRDGKTFLNVWEV